jgi:predicted lipid-binding transport protein (Tim44 family)
MNRDEHAAAARGPDAFDRFASGVLGAAVLAALVGVLVAGDLGRALDVAAIAALGALPIARVAMLAVRWWRAGDRRYAGAAGILLALMVAAVLTVSAWR